MYSWKAFLIADILVKIPYQIFLGILVFGSYYYAMTGIQSSGRQGLVLLYCIQFFVFGLSFAHMLVAGLPDAETAGAVTTLLFSLILVFNGVMQVPSALPGFWIFMYRVSPFTYWVAGIVATILHDRPIVCSAAEYAVFNSPSNQTCGEYMAPYLKVAPGYLRNAEATAGCQYMAGSEIYWHDRWRNFGLVWVYVVFNIVMARLLYWALRVKRWNVTGIKERFGAFRHLLRSASSK